MKKYPCIESTVDIPYQDQSIRLWIDETKVKNFHGYGTQSQRKPISDIVEKILIFLNQKEIDNEVLIDFIHKNIPHVSAVQIKDKNHGTIQYGTVAYFVDFTTEDVHG